LKTLRQFLSGDDVIQLAIRLGMLAFLIYWAFVVVRPFVPILAWSVILAVALYPVFAWLTKVLGGRPRLAAAIITIVNLGIVIGPATWLGLNAVEGIKEFAGGLSADGLKISSAPARIKDWPLFGPQLYELWDYVSTNLRAVLHDITPHLKPLASKMLELAGNASVGVVKFLLSVGIAGFLFIHGLQLLTAGRRFLSRIAPDQGEHFVELAGATIRAVSQGVIGVAIVQSLLAGLVFKLADISSAGVLAFLVLLLSIVQIGAAVVVLPVIVWVWMDKDLTTALLLTVSLVFVGLIDNILKPLVMGRGLRTPTLVIFIGVIGGTLAHGIVGLFIGPIILSVAWELMMAWISQDHIRLASAAERISSDEPSVIRPSVVDLDRKPPIRRTE